MTTGNRTFDPGDPEEVNRGPLTLPVINRGWTWTSELVPMPPGVAPRIVLTNPITPQQVNNLPPVGRIVQLTGTGAPLFYRPPVRPKPAQATLRIGVCGAARSGKDTVVAHLCARYGRGPSVIDSIDIRRYAHADALKVEVFEWLQGLRVAWKAGFAVPETAVTLPGTGGMWTNGDKINWCDENKPSYRKLLQLWGSEYRRGQDANYWISRLDEAIALDRPQVALISDCRFANEVNGCHVTFRCEREGYVEVDKTVAAHVSESELAGFTADYTLKARDGDVAGLLKQAEAAFERVLETFRVQ